MATFLGTTLWDQLRTAFGYLQTQGYCAGGQCKQFPVIIGEVGSALETDTDKQWLQDFADFINAQVRIIFAWHPAIRLLMGLGCCLCYCGEVASPLQTKRVDCCSATRPSDPEPPSPLLLLSPQNSAQAYNAVPLNGWLWWAYNQNSGDTGGIVWHNWQDLYWDKINWMIGHMGLRPWYLRWVVGFVSC